MKKRRIIDLNALAYAAEDRRSLVCPTWRAWAKPKPAAFVFQLSAQLVRRMIRAGLYVYEKEK
ncbi:MAG: hypothetical protein GWP08_20315 [Nitrospiraceae bacterium]|nr:hypothetical protein [Nitrospiraceae bacterium]